MDQRNLIQIANRVQEALVKLRNQRWLESLKHLATFASQLKEIASESRKIGISLTRGWFSATQRCGTRISSLLNDIPYSIQRAKQLIGNRSDNMPALSLLLGELKQLQQEFGNMDFDKARNSISVVTEPIRLDDIYLGSFRIQLELDKLSDLYKDIPYYVIALDPHPAATTEDVTHPHVSNEKLCEGDGSVAIKAALEQGRLYDFFTMVRSILNTYNSDSPYVSLDDWEGEPCYDCGYVMDRENSYYCCYCDRCYCEQCSTYCRSCEEILCLGCAGKCEICEEPICSNCARRCAECGCICCELCLVEDLCPNCKEEMERENEEQKRKDNRNNESQNHSETSNSEAKVAS